MVKAMFSFIWTALIGLQIITEFNKKQQTCQSMTKNFSWLLGLRYLPQVCHNKSL